jgi:hypothetical protein
MEVKEINVDCIGSQNNPLTEEELTAISAFIRKSKDVRLLGNKRKSIKNKKPMH